ncbi:U4/U6-U5 snRNP complex subunit lsm8 [Tieghemiomyces parasiticus]|uniref:LSM2-LSM8 complex subunit LSM8 n=1 Tax=Tieghemiomyces parasiticus TaxID=78921 RepID=A0A9W8A622_9FUNG|nr:U4/U6-U5 snRNP complex subunit lsm8 [Tieghemiomyces parasiticus]
MAVTNDGRVLVGLLKGFDQMINLVVSECVERVYAEDEGVEMVDLGLYFIRGDNVAVVGLVDKESDENIQFATVRAKPLSEVSY